MVSEFQRFLQSIAGDILPDVGSSPIPAPPPPVQPPSGGFSPQLLAILRLAQRQASSNPVVPAGAPAASPTPAAAGPYLPGQPPPAPLPATPQQQQAAPSPVAAGPVLPGQAPPAPLPPTAPPVVAAPSTAPPDVPPQQYVFVEYQTGGTEETKAFFYVPVQYTRQMPPGARVLDDNPESDPQRLGRASEMGMMFEQQDPAIQALFATPAQPATAAEAGPPQLIPGSVPLGPMPANPPGARPEQTPTEKPKPFAQQQEEAGNVIIGYDAVGAPVYGKPGETYESMFGSRVESQTVTTDQLLASGDADLMALGSRLQAAGIPSINSNQVEMTDPQTGRSFLATPDEVVQNDYPISIEQVRETDPEKAKLMEQAGVQWIRPSEGIAQTGDGSVIVLTKEQMEAIQPAEKLPALTPQDIRGMNTTFAGMTPEQVAAGMENSGIAMVGQGQMLVQNPDGSFARVPQEPDATTTDAAGRPIILFGGKSEPRVRMLFDPKDFDQWSDLYRTPLETASELGRVALGSAGDIVGNTIGAGSWALDRLDVPRQWAVTGLGAGEPVLDWWLNRVTKPAYGAIGNVLSALAPSSVEDAAGAISERFTEGLGDLERASDPIAPLAFYTWTQQNGDEVDRIRAEGYDSDGDGQPNFTGDRALWEAFISDRPWWQKMLFDLQTDPLNVLPFAGTGLRTAGRAVLSGADEITLTRRLVGEALRASGWAADVPDRAVEQIVGSIIRPAGRALRNAPGIGRLMSPTDTQQLMSRVAEPFTRLSDVMARARVGMDDLGQQAMPPGTGPDTPIRGGGTTTPAGPINPDRGPSIPNQRQAVIDGDVVMTGQPAIAPTPEAAQGSISLTTPERPVYYGPSLAEVPVVPSRPVGGATATEGGPVLPGVIRPGQRQAVVDGDVVMTNQPALGVPARTPSAAAGTTPEATISTLSPEEQLAVRRQEAGIDAPAPAAPAATTTDVPDWGIAAPRPGEREAAGAARIVDRAQELRQQYPDRWEAFVRIHDNAARQFDERQQALQYRRRAPGERKTPRDFGVDQRRAIAEADYVINKLIPDFNRAFDGVARIGPEDYRFKFPGPPASLVNDDQLIERAIFGGQGPDGRGQVASMEKLESRFEGQANGERRMNQILTLRRQYEETVVGQQTLSPPPTATTAAPAGTTSGDVVRMPLSQIRSTFGMSDEALQAAGVPRLQPRDAPYSEESAANIAQAFDYNKQAPVLVTPGRDGNYYLVSGHSRFEGARRAGVPDLKATIVEGEPNYLIDLAAYENEGRKGFSIFETARNVRRYLSGDTPEGALDHRQVAQRLRLGNEKWAKDGTSAARVYENVSYIPETSRVGELVSQGVIDPQTAGMLGNAIKRGSVSIEDANILARRIAGGEMKVSSVRNALEDIAAGKVKGRTVGINELAIENAAAEEAIARRAALNRERNSLLNQYNSIKGKYRKNGVRAGQDYTPTDAEDLANLERQIKSVSADLGIPENRALIKSAKPEQPLPEQVSGPFEVGGETLRMAQTGPPPPPDDWLRPMTEADAAAQRQAIEQVGMDVGAPQMRGGRQGTPGEALQGGDLLQQPERSAADVMRDSGSQSLFLMRDPKREAAQMYERTRAAWEATLGRKVRNPVADAMPDRLPTKPYRERLYHGSPNTSLSTIQAQPPGRQYDNATSLWGVFFTPDQREARRYAGDTGRIYPLDVELRQPYEMEWSEFAYFQRVERGPDGEAISDLGGRMAELKQEAADLKDALVARGYDGIVLRNSRGNVMEVAVFDDVALPAATEATLDTLGIVRNPRREAEALYGRTLGRKVRNPLAARPASHPMVRIDREPLSVARFRGRDLSVPERAALTRTFADNGETIAARWERYANDLEQFGSGKGKSRRTYTAAEAEHEATARVIKDFAVQEMRDIAPRKYALYEQELARLNAKGGNTVTNQAKALEFAWRDGKKGRTGLDVYDTVLAVLREGALYNTLTGPRYILTQAIGNMITLLLTGNAGVIGEALTPRNYRAALEEIRTGARDVQQLFVPMELATTPGIARKGVYGTVMEGLDDLPVASIHDSADQMLAEWNIANVRSDIGHLNRDQMMVQKEGMTGDFRYGRLRTREVADSLRLGRTRLPVGKATTWWANEHVRNWANAFDLSYRKALYAHTARSMNAAARPAFYELMRQNLPSPGDQDMLDELWDQLPEVFGSDRVRSLFAAIDPAYADRMARDWQSAIGRMDAAAREETRRVFFSGEETNADKYLRRIVFFHYWASRATPLYVEGLARNPGLLNAYMNMMTEMKERAESGEYGSAVKGFLYVMSTGLGYNIFIRPDALIQTFASFAQYSDYSPEGENLLGKFMRVSGLAWNPIIDTVTNLAGVQGDTFTPDPLMLGQWTGLVQRAVDLAKSYGFIEGDMPTGNRYQDAMASLRSDVSGFTSDIIPGISDIPYRDSVSFARRDINELIYNVAEEQGLETDDPIVLAAMDDPNSALYQEAFRRYASGRGVEQLLRATPGVNVLFPKLRLSRPDERRAMINDRATPLDERQRLQDEQQMATIGNPQSRALELAQREIQELGTAEQQAAYQTYNAIRYGDLDAPVKVNGVYIRERQLAFRTADERQAIADQWARESGNEQRVQEMRDLRSAYIDSHPDYAAYVDWRNSVSDYDGGPAAYWDALSRNNANPNAARYYEQFGDMPMDDLERQLTSIDAYMAVQGIQPTIYDPAPISTSGNGAPFTPSGTGGGDGQSPRRDPAESIRYDIAEYQQQVAVLDAQTEQALGIRASQLQNVNPMARAAYEQRMQSMGMSVPSLSQLTQDYLMWAQGQPPGADITPETYIRWRDAYMQQNGAGGGPASDEMIQRLLGR